MGESIHVLLLVVDCHIPHAQSLKQKRAVVKGLIDRLRARLNASVAETGFLDEWKRSVIAVSLVSNNRRYLQQQVDILEQTVVAFTGELTVARIEQHSGTRCEAPGTRYERLAAMVAGFTSNAT